MFTSMNARISQLVLALAALLLLTTATSAQIYPRRINDDSAVALVQSWYQRYLHRSVDPTGYQAWVGQLENGVPPRNVEAGILASDEYYQVHNSNAAQFIIGLHVDVLGRSPSRREVGIWLDKFEDFGGDRERLARVFLREVREPGHR